MSDSFPYPTRRSRGPLPIAYFDTGSGPPVLLIHGLGSNFTHYQLIAPALARHHRVIGVDLPGNGESDKPEMTYTIDVFIDACVRLLDELHIPHATWVGHSLGGMVTAGAALKWPARVERMVLLAGAGFTRYPLPMRLGSRAIGAPVLRTLLKRLGRRLLLSCFHQHNAHTEWFMSQTDGRPEEPTVSEFARVTASLLPDITRRNYLGQLDQLVQPTLVIWGDRDRLLPFAPVERWVRQLPDGRLVVLRDCGHLLMIERPHDVARELLAFTGAVEHYSAAAG